jgi:hypothetical protein
MPANSSCSGREWFIKVTILIVIPKFIRLDVAFAESSSGLNPLLTALFEEKDSQQCFMATVS